MSRTRNHPRGYLSSGDSPVKPSGTFHLYKDGEYLDTYDTALGRAHAIILHKKIAPKAKYSFREISHED